MKLKATCMHEASNVWSSCLAKCYFCSFQDGCCESSLRGAAGRSPETRLPYCRRLRICKAHECVSILPSMSNQSLVLLFAKTAFFFLKVTMNLSPLITEIQTVWCCVFWLRTRRTRTTSLFRFISLFCKLSAARTTSISCVCPG